ncbi:MAG: alpha/beta fold hydrolase [bacterium]
MKKALILHAWFSKPESNWYPWLKSELEKKGYEVWVPQLPTFDGNAPDLETAIKFITDENFVDKDTVVIGHSLGTLLTMRLAERMQFGQAILLAAWDYNDLTPEHKSFWTNMIDHDLCKKNVAKWSALISDNDPYVTKILAGEVADRFGAEKIYCGAKEHFSQDLGGVTEVPEILRVM